MRRSCLLILLLVPALASAAGADTDDLTWLTGCWELTTPKVTIEETWTRATGGTLLMMGRTLRGGRTVSDEFVRLSVVDGRLTYMARIGTPGMTPFPLLQRTADELIFENKAHDFPQRIIYRRSSTGLLARVEGEVKGKMRAQEFDYHACK